MGSKWWLGDRHRRSLLALVVCLPILVYVVALRIREMPSAVDYYEHDEHYDASQFRPMRVIPAQPAIKNAPVVEADRVREQVTDTELVLGVVVKGEARAYPINMLTGPSREIINDTLGGQAIAATW